jgi:hypothetical protein
VRPSGLQAVLPEQDDAVVGDRERHHRLVALAERDRLAPALGIPGAEEEVLLGDVEVDDAPVAVDLNDEDPT